eukprot:3113842-Pyramimonas_sp.AAC.1
MVSLLTQIGCTYDELFRAHPAHPKHKHPMHSEGCPRNVGAVCFIFGGRGMGSSSTLRTRVKLLLGEFRSLGPISWFGQRTHLK